METDTVQHIYHGPQWTQKLFTPKDNASITPGQEHKTGQIKTWALDSYRDDWLIMNCAAAMHGQTSVFSTDKIRVSLTRSTKCLDGLYHTGSDIFGHIVPWKSFQKVERSNQWLSVLNSMDNFIIMDELFLKIAEALIIFVVGCKH